MSENKTAPKVKGALLVPLAMVIRDKKIIDWPGQTELTEADMKVIRSGIMSSTWYDLDFYERMGWAVYKMIGHDRPEGAFQFGYGLVAEIFLRVYRGPLNSKDPREILSEFARLYGTAWYNRGRGEFTPTENGGVFRIHDEDGVPLLRAFLPMLKGIIARLVKESIGKNVTIECGEENLPEMQKVAKCTLFISWE